MGAEVCAEARGTAGTPAPPPLSLTQACPQRQADQQQQRWHQRPRLSPTEPHGPAKSNCLSEGLSAASRAPSSWAGLGWAGGGCFWHLLLPHPGAPSSQTTGWTGFGAESAGPMDLALPGRGLKRTISCCCQDKPGHPHTKSRRAREGPWSEEQLGPSALTTLPHPVKSSHPNSPQQAAGALHSLLCRKGSPHFLHEA